MAGKIENRFWDGLQLYRSSVGVFCNDAGQRRYINHNSIVEDGAGNEVGRGEDAAVESSDDGESSDDVTDDRSPGWWSSSSPKP
jgi:hypothetical protein